MYCFISYSFSNGMSLLNYKLMAVAFCLKMEFIRWRHYFYIIRIYYKGKKYKQLIIYYFRNMPRVEHISNMNANHIYALNAKVMYTHHGPRMTTAIIEDEDVQSKIKIPHSLNNIREDIEEGMNYHFGFCYVAPNGWIKARNPDSTIRPIQENPQAVMKPLTLSEIANNSQYLNGQYLTTLLYVVKVNESQQIEKQGKKLSMCILNCYANGYLVDVTFWNSDLPITDLTNKWVIFSGFRLKKLVDWKFVFVSSVYSKIAAHEGETKSIPYSPLGHYHNLSCVFEPRSILDIIKISSSNDKFYSYTQALVKKIQNFNYDGCSVCKKKVLDGNPCNCSVNSDIRVYSIQKLTLAGGDQSVLEVAVFDQEIQKNILNLKQPTVLKFNLKSCSKVLPTGQRCESHIVTKATL